MQHADLSVSSDSAHLKLRKSRADITNPQLNFSVIHPLQGTPKMNLNIKLIISVCFTLLVGITLAFNSSSSVQAEPANGKKDAGEPVEPDMHEFMEYVFQPTYKRLKQAMAAEPADRSAWKTIKADSLILAEGGNLLLLHDPEKKRKEWDAHSIEVRKAGGLLYKSAKAKDFKAAQLHYQSMLKNCNACHQQFAGGKHQLKP